jgi:hemerythrin-like domain-containing protein
MTTKDQLTILREEHRGIVQQLRLVRRSLEASRPGPQEKLHESISELGSRLEAHFDHEERTLYGLLDSRLKRSSPTSELVKEHRVIQGALRTLQTMGAERAPAVQLEGQLSSLRSALNRHLEKEEKVVFWLADYHL